MKGYGRQSILLSCTLLSCLLTAAQIKIEHADQDKGTLKRESHTLKFIRGFKALPEAKASSLANTADKIMDEICRFPQVNTPTGYNAKVNVAGSDLAMKDKEPKFTVYCYFRYLTRDSRYQGIRESMDGADLILNINAFDIFHQMGNYWEKCSKLKLPVFFEAPALTDSTSDYIEFNYKGGGPVRIVTAGARPLLAPLTRKEFIQFLIADDQQSLKDDNEALRISGESEEQIKKMMATQNEKDKAYSASTLKSMDCSIEQGKKNVTQLQQEIGDCRSLLNTMSPEEANAPVRLDYSKKSGAGGMGSLQQLVPVGRREGVSLVKVNPGFYDHSPNAPAAQMIMLYYAWPTVGFTKAPDHLQQAMLDLFKQVDYHRLKESMR
ncbi:MAG TPA: hypothetical protein VG605_17780 [Puia sp.]|nr:hypothetical protein [Puia sp.]